MTDDNEPYPEPHTDMDCEICTTGNMATCVYTDEDDTEWYICAQCDTKKEAELRLIYVEGALQAGIPRSVIEGKTELKDHFSTDYINWKCGKKPEEES